MNAGRKDGVKMGWVFVARYSVQLAISGTCFFSFEHRRILLVL